MPNYKDKTPIYSKGSRPRFTAPLADRPMLYFDGTGLVSGTPAFNRDLQASNNARNNSLNSAENFRRTMNDVRMGTYDDMNNPTDRVYRASSTNTTRTIYPSASSNSSPVSSYKLGYRKQISSTPQTTFKLSSVDPKIVKLQQSLIKAGYNVGSMGADGKMGRYTQRAMQQAQRDGWNFDDSYNMYQTPQNVRFERPESNITYTDYQPNLNIKSDLNLPAVETTYDTILQVDMNPNLNISADLDNSNLKLVVLPYEVVPQNLSEVTIVGQRPAPNILKDFKEANVVARKRPPKLELENLNIADAMDIPDVEEFVINPMHTGSRWQRRKAARKAQNELS